MMKPVRYVEHLAIQQAYDIKRREILPHFIAMLALALIVHALVIALASLMQETKYAAIPLQALTVRLGGSNDASASGRGDEASGAKGEKRDAATAAPKPQSVQQKQPSQHASGATQAPKPVRTLPPPTVKPSPGGSAQAGGSMTQGGLASSGNYGTPDGHLYGNSLEGKAEVDRYTRQISLQVQAQARNVRLTEALKRSAEGKQVVVELLLVIGPDGRLKRYTISHSSGFKELDQAAIGAAYNAAPFPPPPAQYSGYGFKVAVFVD